MLFYSLKSTDQYLYHYTRSGTALRDILPERKLLMRPFTKTDDPREAKDWTFGFRTDSSFDGVSGEEFSELERLATELAKGTCKLLCFTADDEAAVGFDIDKIWHRGFCRPRMWAHRAECHTGVCLVFDRGELRASLGRACKGAGPLLEGSVTYRNRSQSPSIRDNPFMLDFDAIRELGTGAVVRHHVEAFRRELFFEKALDWSDEKEFRWVLWDADQLERLFCFDTALRAVVMGPDFDEEALPDLDKHRRAYGFELGQLNWKNGVPEIVPRIWPRR